MSAWRFSQRGDEIEVIKIKFCVLRLSGGFFPPGLGLGIAAWGKTQAMRAARAARIGRVLDREAIRPAREATRPGAARTAEAGRSRPRERTAEAGRQRAGGGAEKEGGGPRTFAARWPGRRITSHYDRSRVFCGGGHNERYRKTGPRER